MHADRFNTADAERRAVFDTLPAMDRVAQRLAGALHAADKPVEPQVRALGLA